MMGSVAQSPARGRVVAYDALRVFAILTVVAIHTLMPYRDVLPDSAPVRVFDDVLHYAVPLFVFISGALLWSRPWRGGAAAFAGFVRRRTVAIAVPFLAWACLYAALYVWRAADHTAAARQLPGLIATGHVWYHLYFVPMLLTFYLLTPLAAPALQRAPGLTVLACYALRIVAGPSLTHAAAGVHPLLGQYATHVLSHLPHMALGAWFALTLPGWPLVLRRVGGPALTVGGLAGLTALSYGGMPAWPAGLGRLAFPSAMAATVIGMALIALWTEPRYERWAHTITRAGGLAFGVYFVHPLFLLVADAVFGPADPGSLWWMAWFPVVVFGGVSAASFTLSGLLGKYRGTAWLVGLKEPVR